MHLLVRFLNQSSHSARTDKMGLFSFNFVKCSLVYCVMLSLHENALSKNVLPHHRCSVGEKFEEKEDIPCKPRSQVVQIPKLQPHDVFTPTAIVVKRCSGGCSNMRNCSPKAVESKCVLVMDIIKSVYEFREIEEHTECVCCDITEDMCNEKQEFLANECVCACRDKSEEEVCTDQGKDWDPVYCNCMCPKRLICPSSQKWAEETCRCEEKEKFKSFHKFSRGK